MKSPFLLFSILLTGVSHVHAKTAFVPRSSVLTIPRGGAGPLSSDTAVKLYGTLSLASGLAGTLAPSPAMELYGFDKDIANAPDNAVWFRRANLAVLSIGLLVVGIHVLNYDLATVNALVAAIWSAEWIHTTVNKNPYVSMPGETLGLLLAGSSLYGTLMTTSWAPTMMKILYGYAILGGLIGGFFDPAMVRKFWDLPAPGIRNDAYELNIIRYIGYNLLNMGILGLALMQYDQDIIKATGWTTLVGFVEFVKALALGEIVKDSKTAAIVMWLAILGASAVTILV